ncbi:hypothetical protein LTR50_002732 [Elasticomyces elasticus]|nr:hypothetical protein LTR50_002732 [Elasticomyces elasticus]
MWRATSSQAVHRPFGPDFDPSSRSRSHSRRGGGPDPPRRYDNYYGGQGEYALRSDEIRLAWRRTGYESLTEILFRPRMSTTALGFLTWTPSTVTVSQTTKTGKPNGVGLVLHDIVHSGSGAASSHETRGGRICAPVLSRFRYNRDPNPESGPIYAAGDDGHAPSQEIERLLGKRTYIEKSNSSRLIPALSTWFTNTTRLMQNPSRHAVSQVYDATAIQCSMSNGDWTIILRDFRGFARAHVDDMVIFSATRKEHLEHLDKVFSRFAGLGISLSPKEAKKPPPTDDATEAAPPKDSPPGEETESRSYESCPSCCMEC